MKFISTTEAGKKWGLSSRREVSSAARVVSPELRRPVTHGLFLKMQKSQPMHALKAVNI